MTSDTQLPARPKRADARRNYDRLLAEAQVAVAAHGTDVSLEDIARRAGVGIGTLYRHFPTRDALMAAVFSEQVEDLFQRGAALPESGSSAGAALETWIAMVVNHATRSRGLAAHLKSCGRDSGFARCHTLMRQTTSTLLERAQRAGDTRADVTVDDLMHLVNGISWVIESRADAGAETERLLSIVLDGLRPRRRS